MTATPEYIGKKSAENLDITDDSSRIIDELALSSHEQGKLSRQRMAWVRSNVNIEEVYDKVKVIGRGSMGEVSIVSKRRDLIEANNGSEATAPRQYACKSVSTVQMNKKEIDEFINEIEILRELDHPNVIKMYEIYYTNQKIWIVTELCMGGDLGKYEEKMPEWRVVDVMEQILRAVTYMHQNNICHRDLKFENIMILQDTSTNSRQPMLIKLIDFGLGAKFTRGAKMNRACGTVYTAAPEIVLQNSAGYTEKADIWSIGVLAFILLSGGEYPFLRDREELKDKDKRDKLRNAEYTFGQIWDDKNISEPGRTFVSNCLKRHPGSRWSASKALTFLQTEWNPSMENSVDDNTPTSHTSNVLVSQNIKNKRVRMETKMLNGISFYSSKSYGEFKKRVLLAMAYHMDQTSISELRDIFFEIDNDNFGTLTIEEFKGALDKMHADKHLTASAIEKMFKGIDVDGTGKVGYHEFLAALLESQGMITTERIAETFERIDSEGKGFISKENLKSILGSDYNPKLVDKIMIQEGRDGRINYEDFLRMFHEDDSTGFFQKQRVCT